MCVIFIYDCCPNGVGLSDKLFECAELLPKSCVLGEKLSVRKRLPLCICSGRGGGRAAGAKKIVKMMLDCMTTV